MTSSLRRRLLTILLSMTLAGWAVLVLISLAVIRNEVRALFDAHLAQSARVLASLVTDELYDEYHRAEGKSIAEEYVRLEAIEAHLVKQKYEKQLAFQITLAHGKYRFYSTTAPEHPLSNSEAGFSSTVIDGKAWRVFTLPDRNGAVVVRVGEPDDVRGDLVNHIALVLIVPLLVGVPLLAFLVWNGVGRALRPLRELTREIRYREPSYLQAIPEGDIPLEIRPLVSALNRLFDRLQYALEGERRFTADAAHEMRTPLAALKTQAQVALRTADEQNRKRALQQLIQGVDRATHLVSQLLMLARLDPEAGSVPFEVVSLPELVRSVVAERAPIAAARRIGVRTDFADEVTVRGNGDSLKVLLGNLLDNAIRYTPEGGRVRVAVRRDDGNALLEVADSGPGIPQEQRQDVFRRFFRGGGGRVPGSGLGLSIVQRIVGLHDAAISLGDAAEGGLLVRVRFSAPAA